MLIRTIIEVDYLKKKDLIILIPIIAVIILSFVLLYIYTAKNGDKVVVMSDNEILCEYSLNDNIDEFIRTDYGFNHLVINDGNVLVTEADCKSQVCVNTGCINNKGQLIVCLPHRLCISIE